MFYNTIISWAVYYFVMSFNGIISELPWKNCNHHWNTECCFPADAKKYPSNATNETMLPINCTGWVYSTEEYFL
jgi:SNF family Na+-dependent transporter